MTGVSKFRHHVCTSYHLKLLVRRRGGGGGNAIVIFYISSGI